MITAEDVLLDIEHQAETHNIPFIGPYKGQVLIDVIREKKPKNILEVGTNVGYSAILMARALQVEKIQSSITSLEIDQSLADIAESNCISAGVKDLVNIQVGDAKKTIPQLSESYQMVFLDAAKSEYLKYLQLLEPKIVHGGIVVADNVGVFVSQLREYLYYVRESGNYESQTYEFSFDAVEVSTKL